MTRKTRLDPEALLTRLQRAEAQSESEEDLRVRIEHTLRDAIPDLPEPRYEKSVKTATYLGRADAVHARLVIEYEKPRRMKGALADHAVQQLCDYLTGLAIDRQADPPSHLTRAEEERLAASVGVATDGQAWVFVQRRRRAWHREVRALNLATAEKLLLWFRATARKDLSSANLIRDFGPATDLASEVVKTFAELVASGDHPKATVVYEEWQRIFGIVYGTEQLARSSKAPEARSLKTAYHLALKHADFPVVLFAIHTYYALLMKMLATELIVAQGGFTDSFIGNLTRSTLREKLTELESGEILQSRNIRNAIEQDFFGWYTSAWTKDLGRMLWHVAETLSAYDIATFELKPDLARDLLKDLYHGLIPDTVRHALGEYYTPDWLAEHTIELAGYDGDPRRSFLDPSCGSGTFLLLAIQRVRDWLSDHAPEWTTTEKRREALSLIQHHIVGFDLNPLAVIASRTNYLFALGPLLRYHTGAHELEIPVYLTDSVLLPGQVEAQPDMFAKDTVAFPMTVATFEVPRQAVDRRLVPELMNLLHEAVAEHHTAAAFVRRAEKELELDEDPGTADALTGLFNAMSRLDREGKNRIWAKLIRNRYASLFFRRYFDFVVGNPPHVNWEYLTVDWRNTAEKEYKRYGLFTLTGLESRHGGGKKDIAALFTYAVMDHFVKPGGVMALVAHVSLFKTSGAGEGFRRFQLGDGQHFRIDAAHDFSSFQPFLTKAGMRIKTRTLTFRAIKGAETTYPVPYYAWQKAVPGLIPGDLTWDEAQLRLQREVKEAVPLRGTGSAGRLSPWLTLPRAERVLVERVIAPESYKPHYVAHAGLYSGGLNGAYFLTVLERRADGTLLIENRHDIGKIECPKVRTVIEGRFVFPLLRGRGVARWHAEPDGHVLIVQDPKTQRGIEQTTLQAECPRTWAYLRRFEKLLRARKAFRKFFDPDRDPFYSMYAIAEYTFAPHKVVWMDICDRMKACVVSGHESKTTPVPEHTLMFVAVTREDEAHYLAAVLNSNPVSTAIAGYIVDNHLSTHPCENVVLPPFRQTDNLHRHLAELSKQAHGAAACGDLKTVTAVQATIDGIINRLWE